MLTSGLIAFYLCVCPLAAPQESRPAAGRFAGGSVSMADLEGFLVIRYGNDALGMEALEYLIRDRVLDLEASKRGVSVSPEDVRAQVAKTEADIREKMQHSLDDELALKGMDRATFESLYKKQVLCERMVRADLGLPPGESVKREQQELWLSERVKAANVTKEKLPAGVVAKVDGTALTAADLGATLRLRLGRSDLRDAVRSLCALLVIEGRAKDLAIEVTPEDIEAAIGRRRDRFKSDPRMAGVSYEQFLETRGTTMETLRADRGVRAEAFLYKIGQFKFPDEEVDKRYIGNKEEFDGLFGEARHVSWILLHASPDRNQLIKRTYDEADAELRQIAERIKNETEFGKMASVYSTHDVSRRMNGDLGWLHRREAGYENAILAPAFAADAVAGKAIGPTRNSQGSAIYWIHSVRPAPPEAVMRRAVRGELVAEFYRTLLRDAMITTYLDPPAAAAGSESKGTSAAARPESRPGQTQRQ